MIVSFAVLSASITTFLSVLMGMANQRRMIRLMNLRCTCPTNFWGVVRTLRHWHMKECPIGMSQ